jgi:hypothetical protein
MKRFVLTVATTAVVALWGWVTPVQATTITINDTFADNHVELTLILTADDSNVTVSPNCVADGVNLWNCSEGAPIVLNADILRSGTTLGSANLNIWDDTIGGTISDTQSFAFSSITSTTAHATFTFRSGSGVTAFAPASSTVNLIEGAPLVFALSGSRDGGTFTLETTPVPEPASLMLLGTGLVAVARRRFKKRT